MEGGKSIGRIWRAIPQIRTDRRKVIPMMQSPVVAFGIQDRVEPSHRQLSDCITKAEELTNYTGTLTRVIGWYHSHPNITVQPSHVDLRTQAQHQSLDSGFVGLIFSCFNRDQVLKCTAFQTIAAPGGSAFPQTVSSGDYAEEELKHVLQLSMQEYQAQNHSNEIQYIHREIPLNIVQPSIDSEYSLMDCANLHKILFYEETQAYKKTLQNQKQIPNLVRLQQCCAYCQSILQLSNTVLLPNLNSLMAMDKQNDIQLRQLDEQIRHYKTLLSRQEQRNRASLEALLLDCPSLPSADIDTEYPLTPFQKPRGSSSVIDNGPAPPRYGFPFPSSKSETQNHTKQGFDLMEEDQEQRRDLITLEDRLDQRQRQNTYQFTLQDQSAMERQGKQSLYGGSDKGLYDRAMGQGDDSSMYGRLESEKSIKMARVPTGDQCIPFVSFPAPDQMLRPSNQGQKTPTPLTTTQTVIQEQPLRQPLIQPESSNLVNRQRPHAKPLSEPTRLRTQPSLAVHSAGVKTAARPQAQTRLNGTRPNGSSDVQQGAASMAGNIPRMEPTDDYEHSEKVLYRRN